MATQYAISGTTAREIAVSAEHAVTEGRLRPGEALPPVRALAQELAVSPGTVATAYKELRRRGIVVTRGRGGTVVAPEPSVTSRRPPPVPEGLRDLSGGHPDPAFLPDLVPPGRLSPGARSHRASPRLPELEESARAWFRRDGVPDGRVTFAHGALDCIARLLSVELRPGDAVAVEDPGFHHLLDLVRALGLRTVAVPVDDEGPRPEGLRAALRAGARAVVLCPRAQNPFGSRISAARRDELLAVLAAAPEVLVIEDDHSADTSGGPLHSLTTAGAEGPARWAQVRTVSKHLGTDLRWTAMACDARTLARHDGRMLLTSGWVSHVLQETVARLMTDPATNTLVAAAATAYGERRRALVGALAGYGIGARGVSGFNVWVPVRDESAVVNGLRSHGWWVAGGARFRIESAPGVRITVADLEVDESARLAGDFAAVLAETQSTYGG
ncbi:MULTISPECIES: aminotransferase class I/II-fold pyridoxal phosphate-dependent enzyme [unclassified Streptomyces]|uniref:aminotransferase class I/II-fold pyridoxal phosphate-dependent enzyme n=1 Tax=unclassified Streptomyces TaxID=2593676 RepID=UPI002E2C319E|nr:aminotransferase class I/II-fold pyridoxal phosphate-dependent enzyme [Streptomyces sp. NBC_00223]